MIIYLLYCPESGKGYVGQTIYTLEHRWKEHLADAKFERDNCRALEAAIRKYGASSFEKQILQECITIDELNSAEEVHKGKPGHPHTEESKRKISEANRRRAATKKLESTTTDTEKEESTCRSTLPN